MSTFKAELKVTQARLAEQQRIVELRAHEHRLQLQQEKELQKLRLKHQQDEENEAKTRHFFSFNRFQRKVVSEGSPRYYMMTLP
jgi:hypothetical protein